MKSSLSRLFFVVCAIACNLLFAVSLFAVPAYRGWQTKSQPDGSTITVRLVGDEFFHYWETEDGKIAVENEDGTFVVTAENRPTAKKIAQKRNASPYMKRPIRKIGEHNMAPRGLVVLVNFSNISFKAANTRDAFDDLMNNSNYTHNGAYGSVREYFRAQSNGQYVPDFDVVGPITLTKTRATYGANTSSEQGSDTNPAQMIVDACKAVDNTVDFTTYDNNNDGYIDFVYVIYAGEGEADGGPKESVWPHNWYVKSGAGITCNLDGKKLDNYACSAELNHSDNTRTGIGTIAHEFGHVIGLPDYYDTDYGTNDDNGVTPYKWSIMDQGSYNNDGRTPPNYSIFDKYFMGWATPKFLKKDEKKNVTMTTGYDDAYQITGGTSGPVAYTNTGTVYYIENRQKNGWDAYLPGSGMLVWQVKYNASAWSDNEPNNTAGNPRYTIVPADGKTTNFGRNASDIFPTSSVKSYTPYTGCALSEITKSGSDITFKYNGGETKNQWDYSLLGENCTVPADGIVALNGTLNLTITPDAGYSLADAACWTVEMGDAELTYGADFTYNPSTNTFTITPVTGDVTILADAAHIITWIANGVTHATNIAADEKITLPSVPSDCSGTGGKKFVGWCTNSSYANATTAPTFAKTGDTYSVSTYYAVYASAGAGGGSGTSEVASVTFSNASSDGSADKSSSISDLVSSDSGIDSYSGTKVYAGTTGAKIGASKASGSITLTLSSAAKVKTVKVTAKKYGSDTGTLSVSVGSTQIGSAQTPPANTGELTFTADEAVNGSSVTIGTSSKRAYISSIIVIAEGGSGTSYSDYSTTCSTCTLSSITLNTDAVTKTFTQGDAFSSEGLVVTATYSDCSDRTVSPTSVSEPDMATTGSKTVTVTYTEGSTAKTATYSITVNAAPTFAIRFFNNGLQIGTTQNVVSGQSAIKPADPTACEGYTFVGWWTAELATTNTDAKTWITNFIASKDQDYYAVYEHTETSGGGGSTTESVTFSDLYSSDTDVEGIKIAIGTHTSVTFSKGSANSKYYTKGSAIRWYGGGKCVVESDAGDLTNITFSYGSGDGSNAITATGFTSPTWTGDATSVTFNQSGTSGNRRIAGISATIGSSGSFTAYYTTSPDCAVCENKVTITKGTLEHGSFTLDKTDEQENCKAGGLVVTVSGITPADGYQFKEITQTGIASGVTIDQTAKTVTYDKDVTGSSTIHVVFEPKPSYTIRFFNNGTKMDEQSVIDGMSATPPTDPEACEGYTFVGWWTETLAATNTDSKTWVTDFTATQNQDYYAVYKHKEGSGGSSTNVVYTASGQGYSNGASAGTQTIDGVTFAFADGGNSTNSPKYYNSSSCVHMYPQNTLVISAENNISSIEFEFSRNDGWTANIGTWDDATQWTGDAPNITFTVENTSGFQMRISSITVTIGGGGTTYYTTTASCSGHTVMVADAEHGSGESDRTRCDEGETVTITLSAEEGYECNTITTSPVTTITKTADCTYTFTMPDEDITVTPVFTAKPPRTFTFHAGTGTCATVTMDEETWNAGVTLPTATANSGCDPEYTFAGWATAPVEETSVRPALFAAGTLYNGAETTLYAVYSQTTGGSASGFTLSYTYNEVTYYVTARSGSNSYMGASTDAAEAARFTIVTSNDKKYLCWHGEYDTYVHNSGSNTTLKFTTELANASDWTVTEEETTISLQASSGRYFMFNTTQKDRFSTYASPTNPLTKGDAGTTLYNSNPSCVCYSIDITYDTNGGTLAEGCENITGGDCERDWRLCDAPTREGYLFTNWRGQNGTLYDAGAVVTDLKISLILTAQWIPAPYTVLFDAGSGSCVASLTESSRGDGIILPKAEPSAACAEDWTFIGWSATKLEGETNTSATIIGVAGATYTPTADNITLYAVYSTLDIGGASSDYTRISDDTPAEGDYAIVLAKSDENFGLLTYGTTKSGRLAYTQAYSTLPATITSPAATQIWHLTYDASGYAYLYNAEAGAYLAANGNNIIYNANAGSAFLLDKDAGIYGDYACLNDDASSSSNYYLGVNKDANADYVRYYNTATLIAANSVTLYKGSTGTRYYSTAPACTPCQDPEWSFALGTSVVKTRGSEPFTNTVVKENESSGTVTYSSTNEAVATVDATGKVTLREAGFTTITLRLTKAMPYCATVIQYELEVKEPSIDVVGVTADGEIIIEHDLDGELTVDLSEGNTVSTGTAANDLFFSKYFEAASNMKLFAIFNGTGHEMDLSNIRVRCNCTTFGTSVWPTKQGDLGYVELKTVSKLREQYPKMKIPSGTELIFWSNNKGTGTNAGYNTALRNCIEFTIGEMTYHYSDLEAAEVPNWFCLGDYTTYNVKDADGNNQFVFNGDDSMILERYNPSTGKWEAIDIFGAGTPEAPADITGLVEKIETKYIINGTSQALNDGTGFHAVCEGNLIPLSTNRYMLVRKNTVLDGRHAVESNTASFATLCEEWDGTPIGGATDSYCISGELFSEIGEFDYAENYVDWEQITTDKYTTEENEDGTVSVIFTGLQDLDARACSLLRIEVRDKEDNTNILASAEYKIPIVVKEGEVLTTASLFHDKGDKCATCDVAVLGNAVLTKAADGSANDMPEVRDIYVYGGGRLVVPAGAHYKARDIILRMQMADDNINVSVPDVQIDGSLTNQYGGFIRQQVRVGTSRFYQMAVPYPVRLDEVTFSDGTPAVYGEDFMIRYYDGEQRAQNLGTASNWRNYEGTVLQPGTGYTLAVAKIEGHAQRELVFPMADASLAEGEAATKETVIHAWGDNTIRANHRGWNFLSNPYLTTYAKDNLYGDAGNMLTTGMLVPDDEHPGWWVNDESSIPYVTLINSARTDYSQEMVSLAQLPPFTTFFVQAGDESHHSGAEYSLTFRREHRAASAPAYLRRQEGVSEARFGIMLGNTQAEDKCGVVISNRYSAAYDMQADLSKEFGSAYSLKLYTLQEDKMQMAFLATHPDSLGKPVPVGVRLPAAGTYTFAIDRRYNLGAFSHIYLTDNQTGLHTDLLDDTYTFESQRSQNEARFSLSIQMRKDAPTGIANLLNGVSAIGREGAVMLTGLPQQADIYIYDMGGRLVHTMHTQYQNSVSYMLPTGVYQIRVQSEGTGTLLRAIVH
ncbi:MAG: M6 family metalloprotease domain-containing protein [Paludibacteraceae bacterium]|nr:M6 family metalloprotease domain-containing protein [Paludibacteraceae bacterium]